MPRKGKAETSLEIYIQQRITDTGDYPPEAARWSGDRWCEWLHAEARRRADAMTPGDVVLMRELLWWIGRVCAREHAVLTGQKWDIPAFRFGPKGEQFFMPGDAVKLARVLTRKAGACAEDVEKAYHMRGVKIVPGVPRKDGCVV
jgi:hypothetical protein